MRSSLPGANAEQAEAPEAVGASAEAESGGLGADELPALWDRLSALSAAECEEAIAALDPVTKTRLEDLCAQSWELLCSTMRPFYVD